jgi:hypothetical protein
MPQHAAMMAELRAVLEIARHLEREELPRLLGELEEIRVTAWQRLTERDDLKYVGRLFHDFRRSAARDMVRAGTPETVAMRITGHKTRAMFDRYNIASDADIRQALKATREYREAQAEKVVAMKRPSAGVN